MKSKSKHRYLVPDLSAAIKALSFLIILAILIPGDTQGGQISKMPGLAHDKQVGDARPGRPIDLNRYCRDRYAGGGTRAGKMEAVLIEPRDAYSWRCRHTWGDTTVDRDIDVAKACTMQWDHWAEARLGNRADPFSWSCMVPPGTDVEFVINRLRTPGRLPKSWVLFVTSRHLSQKCDGKRYSVRPAGGASIGTFRECRSWSFSKRYRVPKNGKDVYQVVAKTTMYKNDVFQIEWWAKDKDLLVDNDCGYYVARGKPKTVYIPITISHTRADDWGNGEHVDRCVTGEVVPEKLEFVYAIRTTH